MTTIEYLKREIHRTELSVRQAHRKPNTPLEEIEGLCEKLKHMQEALKAVEEHWQRVHEQRGWTAGESLTLEQLQGAPHGKIRDKTLQHICDRANELAYAYSPATHIDQEKWETCIECKSCDNCKNRPNMVEAVFGECAQCVSMSQFSPTGFCHSCGRPLTDEAWDELERRIESCR